MQILKEQSGSKVIKLFFMFIKKSKNVVFCHIYFFHLLNTFLVDSSTPSLHNNVNPTT